MRHAQGVAYAMQLLTIMLSWDVVAAVVPDQVQLLQHLRELAEGMAYLHAEVSTFS
jgi:hypothetical protein